MAIDSEIESVYEQLRESETYKIIKLCNDVTHKRIKNALINLKEAKLNSRSAHLAQVLFLETRPDQVNTAGLNLTFFNQNLDRSQQEAVKFTFEQKDLAIIHGPPGTGKKKP